MRSSSLFLWLSGPASLLFFGACLDIQRTPNSDSGGSGGVQSSGGADNLGGLPSFDPCVQQCVDMTPAGTRTFGAVAKCTEAARVDACADVCSGGAAVGEPVGATCAVPGDVDAVPVCSACLKQNCCDALSRCFSDVSCITVGICASGCEG